MIVLMTRPHVPLKVPITCLRSSGAVTDAERAAAALSRGVDELIETRAKWGPL
jgi:hypothetical protein